MNTRHEMAVVLARRDQWQRRRKRTGGSFITKITVALRTLRLKDDLLLYGRWVLA
jgi:hypothetical protein